jgi:cell division protein FtsN
MHIICPNCGLKTPVETGGLSVETRLTCTRCKVEFEIKFTDEPHSGLAGARPAAAAASTEIALFQSTEIALFQEAAEPAEAETGDVLGLGALPPPPPAESSETAVAFEQWQSIIDVGGQDGPVIKEASALEANSSEASASAAETLTGADETFSDAVSDADGEIGNLEDSSDTRPRPTFAFERAPALAAQRFDRYSVGVRLLQVSPIWLLVSGLSFISFVVLCNWFFVPANLAQADTVRPAARGNQATNQSANQSAELTPAPAQPAHETEAAQPAAEQPAQTAAQPATEATPEATPAPASSPTPAPTQSPAPAATAETAYVAVAAARENAAESNDGRQGKFTVQIGSYNAASEAEARASSLKSAGVEARVAQVEIPKRGTWYRVQAGRFTSREDAERHGRQLREKGLAASYLTAELQ